MLGRFEEAFELEGGILVALVTSVGGQGDCVCLRKGIVYGLANVRVAHHDEAGGLHEADRWSLMGGVEEAGQEFGWERLRQEAAADVAALADGAVDGAALEFTERLRALHHEARDHLGGALLSPFSALNSMRRAKRPSRSDRRLR